MSLGSGTPHSARMYDYYLGGKDWFEADKRTAEQLLQHVPEIRIFARENRAFMRRATHALAREHGVRQFLDIGTGIPTEPNLHQVAQRVAPECRVVYVDNDPLVIEYADALLRGAPEGRTAYLEADVRRDHLWSNHPRIAEVLDLDEPVALSLIALMHFLTDEDRPHELLRQLLEPLAPGSFLVLSHTTYDFDDGAAEDAVNSLYGEHGINTAPRSRAAVATFFDGLELLDPGLVVGPRWRPDGPSQLPDEQAGFYAGVARKG